MEKDKIILFLIKYAGYNPDEAADFVNVLPNQAEYLVNRIKEEIIKDNSITDKYKKKIIT